MTECSGGYNGVGLKQFFLRDPGISLSICETGIKILEKAGIELRTEMISTRLK